MKNKTKKEQTEEQIEAKLEDRRITNTSFILMFPALLLAGIAGIFVPAITGKLLVIALAVYQFLMLKKFIQDYYKK